MFLFFCGVCVMCCHLQQVSLLHLFMEEKLEDVKHFQQDDMNLWRRSPTGLKAFLSS